MLQTVTYDEIIDMEKHVVNADLVKHFACYADRWGFVFHNYAWLGAVVIEHTVTAKSLFSA